MKSIVILSGAQEGEAEIFELALDYKSQGFATLSTARSEDGQEKGRDARLGSPAVHCQTVELQQNAVNREYWLENRPHCN